MHLTAFNAKANTINDPARTRGAKLHLVLLAAAEDHAHDLVVDERVPTFDCLGDAALKVVAGDLLCDGVESFLRCVDLIEYVDAVATLLDHAGDSLDLSGCLGQTAQAVFNC